MILNGDSTEFDGGSSLVIPLCLDTGCYTAEIVVPLYPGEASFNVTELRVQSSIQALVSVLLERLNCFSSREQQLCGVRLHCGRRVQLQLGRNFDDGSCEYITCAGCTDDGACNYNAEATFDNSSCDYSCVGCQDATANNYDADATIACDDCCVYCELASLTLVMYDSYGDGWNANTLTIGALTVHQNANGDAPNAPLTLATSTLTSCASTPPVACGDVQRRWCLLFWLLGDLRPRNRSGERRNESGFFGDCQFGCNASACNYDMDADIDDESCDYSCIGCQDSAAAAT